MRRFGVQLKLCNGVFWVKSECLNFAKVRETWNKHCSKYSKPLCCSHKGWIAFRSQEDWDLTHEKISWPHLTFYGICFKFSVASSAPYRQFHNKEKVEPLQGVDKKISFKSFSVLGQSYKPCFSQMRDKEVMFLAPWACAQSRCIIPMGSDTWWWCFS